MNLANPFDSLRDDLSGVAVLDALREIAATLDASSSVLITAHLRPDGDAIGSEVALALALRRRGISVRVLNDSRAQASLESLFPQGLVELYDESMVSSLKGSFDACVLLDTSEPERAGLLGPLMLTAQAKRICIDHHRVRGDHSWDYHVVCSSAPATGCLVLALLDALGTEIDEDIASALWVAIATDTGWFRFANTSSVTMACAARLLDAGASPEALFRSIYGSHSPGRTRLLGQMLVNMRSELEGRLTLGVVTRDLLRQYSVGLSELDGVIDHLKAVRGAEVAALITELAPDDFKISLRSVGDVDVEPIAGSFEGGGHDRAAGCRFAGSLDALIARLSAEVKRAFGSQDGAA